MGHGIVCYSSWKKTGEAKAASWKKGNATPNMSDGGKRDAQYLVTEEKDWNFKKHEFCLVMDRKSNMQ